MLRRWIHAPASALVIVLTIGLSVGVVATIFTAFDAVLLRDLPVRDPDRLVRVAAIGPRFDTQDAMPRSDFEALRHVSRGITIAAFVSGREVVRDPRSGRVEVAGVERVSPSFFDVLGIPAPRSVNAAIVSQRFASFKEVTIDGVTYPVAGVAAFRGTNFANPADVWIPLDAADRVRVIGRLADGATLAEAERVLTAALPEPNVTTRVRVGAERAMLIAPDAPRMVEIAILIAAVLAIASILVAAANVIGVLFAHIAVRRRDLAIRLALGATHGSVARQLILETLPLAIPAALLAHLVALGGSRVYTTFMPASIAPPIDFTPDARAALFAAAASLLATLFAATAAFWSAAAQPPLLKAAAPRPMKPLRAIVIAQLAFTVVILIAAALLVQTARAYGTVDPGFEYDRQLVVDLIDADRTRIREFAERIRNTHGVTHVAIARNTPMGRQTDAVITRDGETRDGHASLIEGDFFGAAGIPLLRGRHLERDDRGVAVVNQAAGVGVGERITVDGKTFVVAGIVRDARLSALAERARPHAWLPWTDSQPARLFVRTRERGAMARDLGAIFTAAGIITAIHPLADTVQSDRWLARTASTIAGALGGFTLLLAAIGLFGVVSTIVTSRARELAVRMALGASRAALARLVARTSARLLFLGLLLGSALAIPAARALASLLFGVEAFDAWTWIAVPLVIALVVAAATLVPAARAMRTEPADLLREI